MNSKTKKRDNKNVGKQGEKQEEKQTLKKEEKHSTPQSKSKTQPKETKQDCNTKQPKIEKEPSENEHSDEGEEEEEEIEAEEDSSGYSEEEIAFNHIVNKRQKVKEEEQEEPEEEKDSEDGSLNLDFELVAPWESFFHSIKMLTQQLCDDQKFDVSGLADALIAQQSLGSLPVTSLGFNLDEKYKNLNDVEFEKMRIKHNNDRDVYGITTVINFSKREGKKFLEDIYGYIMFRAKKSLEKDKLKKFIAIMNSKKIGLFINERYLNLPVQLIPNLLRGLVDDIEFTKQQDDVDDPEDYDFDYFLGIAKWSANDLYYKVEEERLVEGSSLSFKFSCKTKEGTEQYKRVIYLLPFSKYKNILEKIDNVFKDEE